MSYKNFSTVSHQEKVKLADGIYDDYKKGMSEWGDAFGIVELVLEKLNNKELQHHKDTTVVLFAFDKELDIIFENIPDIKGCKTSVEAYLVQQINFLKSIVFKIS